MKTLRIGRIISFSVIAFFTFLLGAFIFSNHVKADKDAVVIVLDPGHGGTDFGALAVGKMEKELNYRVAAACKRELEKYEGVKVYLTREKDEEISLRDRAVFAAEKKADLVISMHFNASESHTLFGAETYVSSKQPLKSRAEKFALTELALLEQYGVPIHGNFTRLNDSNQDYYGIIRESASRGMPTVIVEHCYLDVPEEEQFYDTPDDLERFGLIDATAIAMTYGLRSKELGVDYSNIKKSEQILPEHIYRTDDTAPVVSCFFKDYSKNTNRAVFDISVEDKESGVVSFALSKDGGKTFSPKRNLYFEDFFEFEYIIDDFMSAEIVVAAYNAYGVMAVSEPVYLSDYVEPDAVESAVVEEPPESEEFSLYIPDIDETIEEIGNTNQSLYLTLFLISSVLGICAVVLLVIIERKGIYIE